MIRRAYFENAVSLAALVASLWTAGEAHLQAADPDRDRRKNSIRVGIITQADGPHLEFYLKAVAACQGVSQVAICDESGSEFERARQAFGSEFPESSTYRSPAHMFEKFQPKFVIVAMPADLSPNIIRLTLEAGCHVLTEKPGCVRVDQFAELAQMADAKNLQLMLSLPHRVSPQSLRAREIIQHGLLGKLYAVNGLQVKDQTRLTRPEYQQSWFASKDRAGGGHLIWLGIHHLDQILFLTGDRIEEVTAFCRNVGGQPVDIEDAEALALHFKSGMVGTFHGGYYLGAGEGQSGLTFWGSKGWLRMSAHHGPDGSAASFQWYSTHPDAPPGVQTENPTSNVDLYQSFVQAAVDAASGLRETPLTGEDSLQVLKVVFATYQASQTGTVQKVP